VSSNRRMAIGICPGYREHLPEAGMSRQPQYPGGLAKASGQVYLWAEYADAIERAGGLPIILPPVCDLALVPALLSRVDGVLIAGGADVDPARYGQEAHPATRPLAARREAFDLAVLREAEKRRLPVLAICLGIQLLNVARGGTLIQDLPDQRGLTAHNAGPKQPDAFHPVEVRPGTLLASVLGAGTLEVNSSHHQAIDALGRGLTVSATAPDGLVEAIEDPNLPFYIGVQWHPERLAADHPTHQRLFDALAEAAGC